MSYTTTAQVVARMRAVNERMGKLSERDDLTPEEEAEFESCRDEFDTLNEDRRRLRRTELARGYRDGRLTSIPGTTPPTDSYDDDDVRSDLRDRAMRQLDRSTNAGLPARAAEVVERLIGTGPDPERGWVSRWVAETGSDAYRSAFAKLLLHGEQRAGLEFSQAERGAFDRVTRLKAEQRAMSLTDTAGGYLVPFELDPSVVVTSAGSINPLLTISRVIPTVSDVWHGVSSDGVVAEWLSEGNEAADASPTLAEPTIPAHKMSVFVPFSVELQGDATSLMTELGTLLQDGASQLLNTALTTGSGTGQPTGIITALAGTASQVDAATDDTLVSGDVYAVQNALPPRFSANAQWCANLAILNTLRQFETSNGALRFPALQDNPAMLLGRNANELSNMDGAIDAATDNYILLYGDFTNYVVTQRVGSSIELIPHLAGANRRPTGQRGVWLWACYGADTVNANAFRVLTA